MSVSSGLIELDQLLKRQCRSDNQTIADMLAELGSPSTSIAILENGKISSHCYSTTGDNSETLFQACSISKAIAALSVLKLVEKGYFDLEGKICDLLPDDVVKELTKDERTSKLVRSITVMQLMSHTAGLSGHGFPGYPYGSPVPDLSDVVRGRKPANTLPIRLISVPGLQFMYSGGGITLLQLLVQHVAQKPFPEVMSEYVFEPLGMTRSCYRIEPTETDTATAFYTGHTPCTVKWHVQPESAAAGLWTTPTDLLKAIYAVQNSLESSTQTLLKKETAEKMLTIVKQRMGLSWFAKENIFGHGGNNDPGWRCLAFGYADLSWNKTKCEVENVYSESSDIPTGCGIAVMTNAATAETVVRKICHAIAWCNGWPEPPGFFGAADAWVPLPTMLDLHSKEWRNWAQGQRWTDGWQIIEDEKGQPWVGVDIETNLENVLALRPAAIPCKIYDSSRKSLDLLLDGTALMMRLGWDKEERIIELWNGSQASSTILHLQQYE